MVKTRSSLWFLVAAYVCITFALGCNTQANSVDVIKEIVTLRVAIPSFGAEVLDPASDSQAGLQYHGHMYDHLVGSGPDGRWNKGFGVLDSWNVESDGLTVKLVLKKNLTFHDGVKVTADDLASSLYHFAGETAVCGICPRLRAELDSIDVLNQQTIQINLTEPDVAFLHAIGPIEGDIPLVRPANTDTKDGDQPSGTGPWQFTSRTEGESILFYANEAYWDRDRLPGFDRLELTQVADPQARLALLRGDSVDIARIGHAEVRTLQSEGFDIGGPKNVMATTLRFFMSYDPSYLTSDLRFRKALTLGMNIPRFIETVYPPEAASVPHGSSLFSPMGDGYDETLSQYRYDPDTARLLLQEAGYKGETVHLFSIVGYGLTELPSINRLMAADWESIGVKVNIIDTQFPVVQARYLEEPQKFEDVAPAPLFHGAFQTRPDVLSVIKRYMTSGPKSVKSYHDPSRGDMVLKELSSVWDHEDRNRRLMILNQQLYDEYWAIDIAWRHETYAINHRVTGWTPTNGTPSDLHFETAQQSPSTIE